jgi:gliding motility-associated-like protein
MYGLPNLIDANNYYGVDLDLGRDTSFCKGNLKLDALHPGAGYIWSTGQTTQSIIATSAGTYWVNVTDTNGCKLSDTLHIYPELELFNFRMPNIITPNEDGLNDELDFSVYQFSSLDLAIYNRWGNEIFETEDPNAIWKPACADGTYFYVARYKVACAGSAIQYVKGFITVTR